MDSESTQAAYPARGQVLQTSHFLRIPVELRLQIFDDVLPAQSRHYECSGNPSALLITYGGKQAHGSILEVSRQINNEALSVLCNKTIFYYLPCEDLGAPISALDVELMKQVTINIYQANNEDMQAIMQAIMHAVEGIVEKLERCKHVQRLTLCIQRNEQEDDEEWIAIFEILKTIRCPGTIELDYSNDYDDAPTEMYRQHTREVIESLRAALDQK